MKATAGAAAGAVALGLAVAACGSSAPTVTTTTATTATTTATTTAPTPGLAVESTEYGSILATSAGDTLYEHSSDATGKSSCTGPCASVWPAFSVAAVPSFEAGVNEALVNHVGSTGQLTYAGHALYTFSGDKAPGETKGEGIKSFGGTWYVLSAATGKPVTARVAGSTGGTLPGGV